MIYSFFLIGLAAAQSISDLGSSGGNGPKGGIGDVDNPVTEAQAFITDAEIPITPNSTRQLASGPAPILSSSYPSNLTACSSIRNVVIDSVGGSQQEMVGFGHAWTDSTVSVFNNLTSDLLDQVLEELFGQTGNNMGFMRHTIGSSDLSGEQYSYDDNGPSFNEGEPDLTLANFNLTQYGTAMAQMIARMGGKKSDVYLFGSPWSYPGWTKYNDLFIAPNLNVAGGGSYNILNNSFNPAYTPQVVEYFTKYVDAFASYGVKINGLTLMNEPLNYQGGYPCMYLGPAEAAGILNAGLGEAMRSRNITVMAYDHNTDQPIYPAEEVLRSNGYTGAAAWHCYASPVANYSVMNDFHAMFPDIPQFMTECSNYLPQAGSINFEVATSFIPPVKHGASGAAMWVMATNPSYGPHSPYGGCAGCLGSIIVNSSTSYTKTNDYYMIGQFSRFVRRGAVNYNVIAGDSGSALTDNQFYAMAVQNPDSSWAVVFMNNEGSDQDVVLSFTEGGDFWSGTVPNATVTTWLLPPLKNNGTGSAMLPMSSAQCSTLSSAAASSSTSSSSTTPLVPVPCTTHTISMQSSMPTV